MDTFSINDFPEEVLQHIFSLLSVPDRLEACLVCKKWLSVVNCKYLLRNVVLQFNVLNNITKTNMTRNFLNFSFKSVLINGTHYEFFRNISSAVEYLYFEKCEIRDFKMPNFFQNITFSNLKILKVVDCDLWILFPHVPNLTELYLFGNSTITDNGLSILQRSMKNLKILSLYCPVNFDPKAYKRFYPQNLSYEKNPSSNILSLPALKSFISERVNTLKELNLYFNVNAYALEEISSIKNLYLHKISLENCHNCIRSLYKRNCIRTLFKNQQSLKGINLNGIMGLNSGIVKALCNLLPNIEEVYMCNGSFTDDFFIYVFQLKKLKKLNIGNNYASEIAFFKAIENFESRHLRYLNACVIKVTNIDLLIHKCKNLVQLDLSHCVVSDELLHFISENLIHLQDLSLRKTDITDYGLTGISEIKSNELEEVNKSNHKSISNLKGLKKLQLSFCEKITDIGIAFAIRFQYLEYLNLAGCNIYSCNTIETLLRENPNLRKVSRDYLTELAMYRQITQHPDTK